MSIPARGCTPPRAGSASTCPGRRRPPRQLRRTHSPRSRRSDAPRPDLAQQRLPATASSCTS
eukprot:9642894-Lingulodinium_polyedra.AAC.1